MKKNPDCSLKAVEVLYPVSVTDNTREDSLGSYCHELGITRAVLSEINLNIDADCNAYVNNSSHQFNFNNGALLELVKERSTQNISWEQFVIWVSVLMGRACASMPDPSYMCRYVNTLDKKQSELMKTKTNRPALNEFLRCQFKHPEKRSNSDCEADFVSEETSLLNHNKNNNDNNNNCNTEGTSSRENNKATDTILSTVYDLDEKVRILSECLSEEIKEKSWSYELILKAATFRTSYYLAKKEIIFALH